MKNIFKRMTAGALCAFTLCTASGAFFHSYAAETLRDTDWTRAGHVAAVSGCGSAQGLAVGDTYLYSAQVNSGNSICVITRVHKDTGRTAVMKNSKTGNGYFTGLGHANDMDADQSVGVYNSVVSSVCISEFSVNNNVLYQGVDAGLLPQTRSFHLGVKINL